MRRLLAIGALAATLSGCFPYVTSYVHLDAPGVKHLQAACRDVGPPVFAYVESSGLRVEVTMEPGLLASRSKSGFLRVRTESSAVSIPDPIGYVTPTGRPEMSFRLTPGVSGTSYSQQFDFVGLPPITFSGTLKLPLIVVDGLRIQLPVFEFERRPYASIVPLNC